MIGISHIPHCYGNYVTMATSDTLMTPLSEVVLSSHLVQRFVCLKSN